MSGDGAKAIVTRNGVHGMIADNTGRVWPLQCSPCTMAVLTQQQFDGARAAGGGGYQGLGGGSSHARPGSCADENSQ